MASTDMRGFRFPLEPLRQRRAWLLDAAMARVAELRKRLDDTRDSRGRIEAQTVAEAGQAAQAWRLRSDPGTHMRLLVHLMRLQQRKVSIDADITELSSQIAVAQRDAQRMQQQVEMLQRHRTEELGHYRIEQERKSSAQADQHWTARSSMPLEVGS